MLIPYRAVSNEVSMNVLGRCAALGLSCALAPYLLPSSQLREHLGVVTVPYGWMTFAFFQMLQSGAVLYTPTRRFFEELSQDPQFIWHTTVDMEYFKDLFNSIDIAKEPVCPANVETTFDPRLLDFAYPYDPRHQEFQIFFDSWEDLARLSQSVNVAEHRAKVRGLLDRHTKFVLDRWRCLLQPES